MKKFSEEMRDLLLGMTVTTAIGVMVVAVIVVSAQADEATSKADIFKDRVQHHRITLQEGFLTEEQQIRKFLYIKLRYNKRVWVKPFPGINGCWFGRGYKAGRVAEIAVNCQPVRK